MNIYMLLFLAFFSSACIRITDSKPDSASEPGSAAVGDALPVRDLDNQQIPREAVISRTQEPNSYRVHLPLEKEIQIVQRHEIIHQASFGPAENLPISIEDGFFVDQSPGFGKTFLYEMGFIADGEFKVVRNFEIKIPQDLVISGNYSLTAPTVWDSFQRIYFQPGSHLYTYNFDLQIQTDEIISADALIQTFPDPGLRGGRSGSRMNIQTRIGRGILTVNLFGEDGENGANGKNEYCLDRMVISSPDNGSNGKNGGDSGDLVFTILSQSDLTVFMNHRIGKAGIAGLGGEKCGLSSRSGLDGKPGTDGNLGSSCIRGFGYPNPQCLKNLFCF